MENISLIASIISALTALTTSLRGLGRFREESALDIETLKSDARLSGIKAEPVQSSNRNFFIYRLSTFIWFMLSILFAIPTLLRYREESYSLGIMIWASSFILLAVVLLLIWRKIR
ncbi:MAG: hypothetical protein Q7U10_03735 [Thermodesulfovibrionia bacterium]|nr:hypothetical protein [Thermodesulfovibrionia bacterium]